MVRARAWRVSTPANRSAVAEDRGGGAADASLAPDDAAPDDAATDAVATHDVRGVSADEGAPLDAPAPVDAGSTRDVGMVTDARGVADVVTSRDASGGAWPARCADVRRADPSASDGLHTLYVRGDAARPWRAWCHAMATSPVEYLPLVMREGGQNISQYTEGGGRPGVDVRTSYARVRLDPVTLRVVLGDQTFARSTGRIARREGAITSMPYAVAGDCVVGGSRAGVANVDLRGTPFAVAADAFELGGFMPGGGVTVSANGRVVDLRGGGYCGWMAPRDAPYDPVNTAGGALLPLVYVGG